MSERAWRDGDRVISPDGVEWVVTMRGDLWCLLDRPCERISMRVQQLIFEGWRLKETSDE